MPSSDTDTSRALTRLLEATAATTGMDFFRALTPALAEVVGVRIAFAGVVEGGSAVRVLSFRDVDGERSGFVYGLEGTPCERVIAQGVCVFPSGVQELFPRDLMLRDLGVHSYFGLPVVAPDGRVLGLIAALHDGPFAPKEDLVPLLRVFAQRTAAELERLAAEERTATLLAALAESERRYRGMVTDCAEGVWAIDADGKTTFVNAQMAEMLGYTPDEMHGRSMFDFMDERARHEAQGNLARRRRGVKERHEFRFRHRTGRDVWTILSTAPLHAPVGEFAGALAYATDVSEWRGLELKVQHAQKLESLGVLAGGIAHDFNNLLVGIIGNIGLARRETPREAPVAPLLDDIEAAAARAADLTRQLLAYSGKGKFVVERLDVNRVLEEMTHLLGTVISKKAALRLNLNPAIPAVEVDATQLRQVVMNLITNASDSLGEGAGIISITTGVQHVDGTYLDTTYLNDALADGDYAFIEVSDTGAGMGPDTIERIFDPFFTTKFAGRGLGLAAVLGILRSHRGAIKVYSEVGRGSTFKILLPAVAGGAAPASSREPTEAPRPGSGLVLVADDEQAVREVARRVLERAGYQVALASDGREAVELFTARKAEVVAVLLDMTMPELGGEEVFRELRRIRSDVRVVLSSGYNEQDATQRFVGKGLARFLQKPWTPTELLSAVDAVIPRR